MLLLRQRRWSQSSVTKRSASNSNTRCSRLTKMRMQVDTTRRFHVVSRKTSQFYQLIGHCVNSQPCTNNAARHPGSLQPLTGACKTKRSCVLFDATCYNRLVATDAQVCHTRCHQVLAWPRANGQAIYSFGVSSLSSRHVPVRWNASHFTALSIN